jgi:hypothetical protein
MTIDAEKVALARAVVNSAIALRNIMGCCWHCESAPMMPHDATICPIPLAQRVIAESEK